MNSIMITKNVAISIFSYPALIKLGSTFLKLVSFMWDYIVLK